MSDTHDLTNKEEHKFVHDRDWEYLFDLMNRVEQLEHPPRYKVGQIVKQGTIILSSYGYHPALATDEKANIYKVIDVDTQMINPIPEKEIEL